MLTLAQTLFTMDSILTHLLTTDSSQMAFYNDDKELFEDLLTISNTKHYKHLRFLSSKHSHNIMKLRFVHKPFHSYFLSVTETIILFGNS